MSRNNIKNNGSTGYIFVDTGEPYNGRIVTIGGIHYSTKTGAKEGNSKEVKPGLPKQDALNNKRRLRGGATIVRFGKRNTVGVNNRLAPNTNLIRHTKRSKTNIGTGRTAGRINEARRRAEIRKAASRRRIHASRDIIKRNGGSY